MDEESGDIALNTFIDTDGKVDVRIYVDKEAIDDFEYQDIKIVFTTYRGNSFVFDLS